MASGGWERWSPRLEWGNEVFLGLRIGMPDVMEWALSLCHSRRPSPIIHNPLNGRGGEVPFRPLWGWVLLTSYSTSDSVYLLYRIRRGGIAEFPKSSRDEPTCIAGVIPKFSPKEKILFPDFYFMKDYLHGINRRRRILWITQEVNLYWYYLIKRTQRILLSYRRRQ